MTAAATTVTALPAGICTRCHRKLTDAKSIEIGRGPVCERKYQAALAEAHKHTSEAVVSRALTLLANGWVSKNDQDSFYAVFSADSTYRTDRQSCTCTAGRHGRVCSHLMAVCLVEAGAVRLSA